MSRLGGWTEAGIASAQEDPGVPRGGQEFLPGASGALPLKGYQGFLGRKGGHPKERREHKSHQDGNVQSMEGWSVADA